MRVEWVVVSLTLLTPAIAGCQATLPVRSSSAADWQDVSAAAAASPVQSPAAAETTGDDKTTHTLSEEPEPLVASTERSDPETLTLADLEGIAFENNPTLPAAVARVEGFKVRLLVSKSDKRPGHFGDRCPGIETNVNRHPRVNEPLGDPPDQERLYVGHALGKDGHESLGNTPYLPHLLGVRLGSHRLHRHGAGVLANQRVRGHLNILPPHRVTSRAECLGHRPRSAGGDEPRSGACNLVGVLTRHGVCAGTVGPLANATRGRAAREEVSDRTFPEALRHIIAG